MSFAGLPAPVQRFIKNRSVFHYTRGPMYWGIIPRLKAALDLHPGDRLLDIGCGTGLCAPFVTDGLYLGIDTELDSLRFARPRFANAQRHFVGMRADAMAVRPKSFDKALISNVAHHLTAAQLDTLLLSVREVVRDHVVLLDLAPDVANLVEKVFLRYDRGEYLRARGDLRPLLARRYRIEHEETFHNTLHIVPQILFRLVPSAA